ncbi:hypothetical protein IscW_ISCW021073 [Ixodes scapularis]|uniref:Uncharacterized protein n=1 Tax=Ixodes scapularis TaxID=6945 RepID=B7Q9U4_IXOSC|nr:hypothetical protein IscW_ISCW021073 [Ixodes scapularis]|eukprot:XP_002406408.1 hypothetical protein IscW_ISCW021073 [Ixodes scapularis]
MTAKALRPLCQSAGDRLSLANSNAGTARAHSRRLAPHAIFGDFLKNDSSAMKRSSRRKANKETKQNTHKKKKNYQSVEVRTGATSAASVSSRAGRGDCFSIAPIIGRARQHNFSPRIPASTAGQQMEGVG